MNKENAIQCYRVCLNETSTRSDAISQMRAKGASPVETIYAIARVHGLSVRESKAIFADNPAWSTEVESADKLHEELINVLSNDT